MHKQNSRSMIPCGVALVLVAIVVTAGNAQKLETSTRPALTVSVNLGGYNLTGPLGFDLATIPKPGTVIISVVPLSNGTVKDVTVRVTAAGAESGAAMAFFCS